MQKTTKIFNFIFLIFFFFFYGCAGAPIRKAPEVKERIITVGGLKYISLIDLIQNTDLDYEYDTFLHSITLSNGSHSLKFFIDRDFALLDGKAVKLSHSSLVDKGELLIPFEIREKIIAVWLAKREIPSARFPTALMIKKIVIDPGHGGKDPGAIGKRGLQEKAVVLDIARRLKDELRSCGLEVVMTRDSDVFIPLDKRAQIANSSGADLFISIHINAHRDRDIKGLEVYYLSNQINDYERALASRNDSLPRKKDLFIDRSSHKDLKTIVWDIIYAGNRKESVYLAKEIDKKICSDLDLRSRGIRAARFVVLKSTKIPAVLVELGFISNIREENKLSQKSYRQDLAKALAATIAAHNRTLVKR